ncbi:MAG TPA: glycosyltransferase, partial [Arachnia sp.]|nr:glycosyltransferase [Arachnia sp.]
AWTVYPYGSRPVADFLGELDFWVYFHGPELHESFGMAALEAMSAGLVTVLPRYMEKTFGEGALYADEADVTQLMEAVWADPSRYAAQSAAAIRTVRERFGAESLLRRVEDSLG